MRPVVFRRYMNRSIYLRIIITKRDCMVLLVFGVEQGMTVLQP